MDDELEIDYGDESGDVQSQEPTNHTSSAETGANGTKDENVTTNGNQDHTGTDGHHDEEDTTKAEDRTQTDAKPNSEVTTDSSVDIKTEPHHNDFTVTHDTANPPQSSDHSLKRKETDERPIDPNATSALIISDLQWWQTEDDIRGWANDCDCEEELKDITFSEHKVNGKSKGQAYLLLSTPSTSTHVKSYLENPPSSTSTTNSRPPPKRLAVAFASSTVNPFRTHPKDAPGRSGSAAPSAGGRGGAYESGSVGRGGFRGRGAGAGRGMGMNDRGFGRGGAIGYGANGGGGYNNNNNNNNNNNGPAMNNPMASGGFPNFGRGGMNPMMAAHQGRGGGGGGGGRPGMNGPVGPNAMMSGMMPMMGMGGMMSGHGGFGPAFFQGQQHPGGPGPGGMYAQGMMAGHPAAGHAGGGGEWNSPHGVKRARPE